MARQVLRTQGASQLELDLAFEPLKSVETARLAISIDDEFGRLHELISVEITLLAEGQGKLVAGEEESLLVIESPQTGDTFSGGSVTVNGILRAPAGLLNIQLISREGRVLKSVDLRPAGGEEETFSTELVYNLPASEWVQVAVSLREDGIVTAFKSAEVWLVP